jgi:hypothetical protein
MSSQQFEESAAQSGSTSNQTDPKFRQLAIDVLDENHRDIVTRAAVRILNTEIVETTYAQIIDGLPLGEVAFESRGGMPHQDHPINHCHDELCAGILDEAREFRDKFDPLVLKFDSRVSVDSHIVFRLYQ